MLVKDPQRKILFISEKPFPPLMESLNKNFSHVRTVESKNLSEETVPKTIEENVIIVFNDLDAVKTVRNLSDRMKSRMKPHLIAVMPRPNDQGLARGRGARVAFGERQNIVRYIKSIHGMP